MLSLTLFMENLRDNFLLSNMNNVFKMVWNYHELFQQQKTNQ